MRNGCERAAGRCGLADLEPGDRFGSRASDFGEQFVAGVMDAKTQPALIRSSQHKSKRLNNHSYPCTM